jgi:Heat induced stress protein YflT
MAEQLIDKPVRIAVYDTVPQAERVVHELLAAGFTHNEISVICSDAHKSAHFRDVQTPEQAGSHTTKGILTGTAIGAAVGGLALAASAIVTGGASVLIGGGALVAGGALAGSFTGAMASRGFEPEMVNYYDQAVQRGKLLVAVEIPGDNNEARLARAEQILERRGAESMPSVEG